MLAKWLQITLITNNSIKARKGTQPDKSIATSSTRYSRVLDRLDSGDKSLVICLDFAPVHILDVRDLEEVFRIGTADTKNGTSALAVDLLLAVHAAGDDAAVLPRICSVNIPLVFDFSFFLDCERWGTVGIVRRKG